MSITSQTNILRYNWDKFISKILGDVIESAAVLTPTVDESKLATLMYPMHSLITNSSYISIFILLISELAQRGFDSALLSDFVNLVQKIEQRTMTGSIIKIKDIEYVTTTIAEYSYHLRRLDARGGMVICVAPRAILIANYRPTIQPIQAVPYIEKLAEDLKTI